MEPELLDDSASMVVSLMSSMSSINGRALVTNYFKVRGHDGSLYLLRLDQLRSEMEIDRASANGFSSFCAFE